MVGDDLAGRRLLPPINSSTHVKLFASSSADWWPTFSALAGLPTSDTSGPTPTDGVDQSQYILGGGGGGGGGGGKVLQHDVTAATGAGALARSPRVETVLDHLMHCVSGPGFDPEQCVRGQVLLPLHVPSHPFPRCLLFVIELCSRTKCAPVKNLF
eukprot:SAG11_NODE_723_length_7528_cov_4.998385_7_plen_156_part_00